MCLNTKITKDDLGPPEIDVCKNPPRPPLSAIFNIRNLAESFQAAFKARHGGIRHVVVILIFLFILFNLQGMGVGMISFPYARKQFIWESTDYFNEWWSTYSTVGVRFTSIQQNERQREIENIVVTYSLSFCSLFIGFSDCVNLFLTWSNITYNDPGCKVTRLNHHDNMPMQFTWFFDLHITRKNSRSSLFSCSDKIIRRNDHNGY